MRRNEKGYLIPAVFCAVLLLAGGLSAEAALVTPLYQVSGFVDTVSPTDFNFGPVVGTPLVSPFGSGIGVKGTLTTTARKAVVPIDLNGDNTNEILKDDLTIIFTLKSSTTYLDYMQVAMSLQTEQLTLVAAGYNTGASSVGVTLKRLNTESDTNSFQLEFGNTGTPIPENRLRLASGKTLEMFVTFHNADVSPTNPTALVKGTGQLTGNIPTLGAVPDPPHVPEPSTILLGLSGIGVVIGTIIRRRR